MSVNDILNILIHDISLSLNDGMVELKNDVKSSVNKSADVVIYFHMKLLNCCTSILYTSIC